ncbi:uncharacterized [Tachysurus ichikawai]
MTICNLAKPPQLPPVHLEEQRLPSKPGLCYLGLLSPSILPCHLHLQQSPDPPLTNIAVLDASPLPWQRQMPLSSTQAHSRAPPLSFNSAWNLINNSF